MVALHKYIVVRIYTYQLTLPHSYAQKFALQILFSYNIQKFHVQASTRLFSPQNWSQSQLPPLTAYSAARWPFWKPEISRDEWKRSPGRQILRNVIQ